MLKKEECINMQIIEPPVIWKHEDCLVGQCKGVRTKHAYSIPFSAPHGLVCECYHCHKTREVKVGEQEL